MKIKNILLTLSLVAFAIGFSDAGESAFWYMGRPVGAILFALFMIYTFLGKEFALYEQEQREVAARRNSARSKASSSALEKNTDAGYHSSTLNNRRTLAQ